MLIKKLDTHFNIVSDLWNVEQRWGWQYRCFHSSSHHNHGLKSGHIYVICKLADEMIRSSIAMSVVDQNNIPRVDWLWLYADPQLYFLTICRNNVSMVIFHVGGVGNEHPKALHCHCGRQINSRIVYSFK
jgi:hypothetical protein